MSAGGSRRAPARTQSSPRRRGPPPARAGVRRAPAAASGLRIGASSLADRLPDGVRLERPGLAQEWPDVADLAGDPVEVPQAGGLEALPCHAVKEAQEVVVEALQVQDDDRLVDAANVA